jgi:hypothetical protein
VYKYSHNVLPAKGALGWADARTAIRSSRHSSPGRCFNVRFGEKGGPEWIPNYSALGISQAEVLLAAVREQWIKPLTYVLLGILLALLVLGKVLARLRRAGSPIADKLRHAPAVVAAAVGILAVGVAGSPGLLEYMTMRRFTLDANHFWVALVVLTAGVVALGSRQTGPRSRSLLAWTLFIAAVTGVAMLVPGISSVAGLRLVYTVFDVALVLIAVGAIVAAARDASVSDSPMDAPREVAARA